MRLSPSMLLQQPADPSIAADSITAEQTPITPLPSTEGSSESHSTSPDKATSSSLKPKSAERSISESPKSASVSRPRLSRTLKRPGVSFRPIEDDDIKYAGAAWKKGALEGADPIFAREMTPEEFRKTFTDYVLRGGSAWTLMAETSRGRMPAAIVIGASANG